MDIPTVEQSKQLIIDNAVDAAKVLLLEHGQTFELARTPGEAFRNLEHAKKLVPHFETFVEAAACLMQCHTYFDETDISAMARHCAETLITLADDLFYDTGETDTSLLYYQLAAGLDLGNENTVRGVLAPCLQGQPERPKIALPYAVFAQHLNPNRNDVHYVVKKLQGRNFH